MSFHWCDVCQSPMRGLSDPKHAHTRMTADTPCAGCPSPILERAPRATSHFPPLPGAPFWHPGCWAAEQRRDTEQRRRPA